MRSVTFASRLAVLAIFAGGGALAGCQQDLSSIDGIFYNGDHRKVHCVVNLDSDANTSYSSIDSGLDRAADRKELIELYAHHPGETVPISKIEYVLAGAKQRGLSFVTYSDIVNDTYTAPGLVLSFDDTSIDAWVQTMPLFAQYDARITFFVSRYRFLSDESHQQLHTLADAGHDIEPHSVTHQRGPEYVAANGMDAYLADEIDPSIQALVDEGFDVTTFAYPFGARTDETDDALLGRVKLLRSVSFTYEGVDSPCPH
jgi:hypothetical protein